MDRGRVRLCDTPAALRGRMHGRLVEVVATPQRRAREALAQLPGILGIQVFGDRLHLWLRDGGADAAAVCAHLARHGVETCGVRAIAPGLEDVFVSLLAENPPVSTSVPGAQGVMST
jgi:ABC-2 type transport system ATP-binding protein